ncbi:hypothetical protein LshimejAT787_1201340 [Lyophyllum shimeji]|uniref:Uncharacterized protein n=1 Tax=Lyophyllum shimeji TaxID=47721 RepID=A0A9P3USN5_LYOSH|nr:hypothetical protein LshimejAT787_1201340 [Lyophyllum shimeji]
MSMIWPDLQDRYLPSMMTRFETANAMAPVTTYVLESLPVHSTSYPVIPRQYDTLQSGLQDITFNWDVQNRLSANKILSAIEWLASAECLGQASVRYLVIVAASTPVDDTLGISTLSYSDSTPWLQMARRLTHAEIQCQLVVATTQNMAPLITLFEETLRLQNFVEEQPSFPIDHPHLLFRLSTRLNIYSAAALHGNPPTQRAPPRRNHSLPLPTRPNDDNDMYSLSPLQEPENPPSLVSQLQQVHGLTKKKVYGAKPVRKPFFREERVQREPPGAPAPLILPISKSPPGSSGSGRALSSSRAARISRVAQSSPTELQPRRPGLGRRNSRMSSPETDCFPSPTALSIPSNASPPVSPTSLTNMYMQPAPVIPSQPETILDPSWSAMQYKPMPHSLSQIQLPAYSSAPSHSQAQWQETDASRLIPPAVHDIPAPYTSGGHARSPRALGTTTQAHGGVADAPPANRLPRRASCPEDEVPFTFNAEYVAATAAMFKNEVLPAYPDLQPAFNEVVSPRRAFYIAQDRGSTPPSPSTPYDPGELYIATERDECLQHPLSLPLEYPGTAATGSPGLSYATSYSPGSSSSLTGWAG